MAVSLVYEEDAPATPGGEAGQHAMNCYAILSVAVSVPEAAVVLATVELDEKGHVGHGAIRFGNRRYLKTTLLPGSVSPAALDAQLPTGWLRMPFRPMPIPPDKGGFERKLVSSKGLMALFAGPSGTGKTMAAEIIAGELGLDLYKIDLSSVIGKFIGETEKNLGRIFDEAQTANAVLFLDEADALFGKRSEVKDSHDRYANIEVGYLLQRIEEYEGIAILATNFRRNMDDAFVRRLQFTVDFALPGEADRYRMWQRILPEQTPSDPAIDLALLAQRFDLTGGNIRNVALAAAFLAADDADRGRMTHLIAATQREYQKMGKLVADGEFGGVG